MIDAANLPPSLDALKNVMPEGYLLSDRVLDPVVQISRKNGRIVANLAGVRMVRGNKLVIHSHSNDHNWILDGNTVRPLPRDSAFHLSAMFSGTNPANLSYGDVLRLARVPFPVLAVEMQDSLLEPGRTAAETYLPALAIPGLKATLFPYQARGVGWMHETLERTGGLILADEMGLGKTLQIIALLLLSLPPLTNPALIVCPTSLIANWVREIQRFGPSLTVMVHRGPLRAGIYRDLQLTNVVITTYDTMVNDISVLSSIEWSWLICDEAQALKNPESNRRLAISTIPRRKTVPMTGTPVENSLLDLWSLVDLSIPGLLGSRQEFEAMYPDSMQSAQAVALLTDPVILKRRIAEVADDLPERIDIDIPIELDKQLAEHYLQVRKATLAKYPVAGALVATLQLQLVCAHPWLRKIEDDRDESGENADVVRTHTYPLMTPKMDRVVNILGEAFRNGQKIIIFALFNRIGELIKEAMHSSNGIYWDAINGSTAQEDRQPIVDRFSIHSGPACLILNPKAAGTGLNITAATVVIHFTPVWNPATEAQASARAHRRGQTLPVTVYRLFYKDTVEEVMIDRSLWKTELANESVPISTRNKGDLQRALQVEPHLP